MPRILAASVALFLTSATANAQSSVAACGPSPDAMSRQVLKVFSDLRVCMLALKVGPLEADLPREWAARASTLILETQRPDDNRRAAISGSSVSWTVNGREAPQDSLAQAWQKAVVELADAVYQADELRMRAAALRKQIDSLPERIAATKSRIVYVEQRDSDLNLQIMNASNKERSVRSQISRMQAACSSAESRAQQAMSRAGSAATAQQRAAAEAEARQAEKQASDCRMQVDRMEMQLMDGASSKTIAAAQEELRALRPQHTLALLRLELSGYEGINVADVEREIYELNAPAQQRVLDAQVETALARLRAILR